MKNVIKQIVCNHPFGICLSGERISGWLHRSAGDQFCRDPPAHVHHAGFSVDGFIDPMTVAGERPEFDINPPLGAPILIFSRTYLLKCFPQGDASARERRF